MQAAQIGFIGYGEVGVVFSRAMEENGAKINIYDSLLDSDEGAEIICDRMQGKSTICATLGELITKSEIILSTVTTQSAKMTAQEAVKYLKPGQMYIDLNSTSPKAKIQLAEIIISSGADFVEGAILGVVGATGAGTRLLTAGEKGKEAAARLNQFGLNAAFYAHEIGKAAKFKMLRGIFSKGLEALILEVLIAGKSASIDKELWEDILSFMTENPFEVVASNWVLSHTTAYERRYWEVTQIVETMQELGVETIMASATEALFKRSLSLDLKEAFQEKPGSYEEVVETIWKKLEGKSPAQ